MERTITADLTGGRTTVEIHSEDHMWLADEPIGSGGENLGPDPYELLLGALAACTCATIELYCRHKQIPLDSVSARFTYDRVHADDCEDCEGETKGFLDRVRSQIFIEGTFDEDQEARLEQVAVRCPVHKTLANGISFTTEQVIVG